ncbi:MAG: hypothetical protein AB1393_09010 [Candidatus Edwardsbacteria bacterium]
MTIVLKEDPKEALRQLPRCEPTHLRGSLKTDYAQTLADNMDVIEEVIQEAKDKEDIPTRYSVLKEIQQRKIEIQRQERIANKAIP